MYEDMKVIKEKQKKKYGRRNALFDNRRKSVMNMSVYSRTNTFSQRGSDKTHQFNTKSKSKHNSKPKLGLPTAINNEEYK